MTRKVTAEDIYKIHLVNDVQITGDGKKIAFTKTVLDQHTQAYMSSIWVIETDTRQIYPYLYQKNSCASSPQWSSDGRKLAFVSDRGGDHQIWIFDKDKGEPYQLTNMKYGARDPIWSKDNQSIFFISEAGPEDSDETLIVPMTEEEKREREKEKKEKPLHIKNIVHKYDGIGMLTDRKTHIWRVDLKDLKPKRLTKGQYNFREVSISSDGKYLVYISDPIENLDFRPQDRHLWMMDVEKEDAELLLDGHIYVEKPLLSKDHTKIIFIGHQAELGWGTINRIYLLDIHTKTLKCLSHAFNRSIGDTALSDMRGGGAFKKLYWDNQKDEIYFLASDVGNTHIFKIDLQGKVVKVVDGTRQIYSFAIDDKFENIAMCYTTPELPNDIGLFHIQEKKELQLTNINKAYLKEVTLSVPEEIHFKSFDGEEIQGWLMKPIDFDHTKKYPAVLEIHGGPQMMYSHSYMHEFQLLAANGYVVIYFNPRGSSGKTQEFTAGIRREYGGVGGGDYKDLMAGMDYILQFDFIDEHRLGVTGGSYGGFMTNWIIGHTNRFKAAVTQRSISNWYSFVGVSDYGYCDAELAHQCDFFRDKEELERISPITYVQNIETPLLIIHSECDLRCPLEQAQQLFTQLKMLGKTVEMLIFPDSSHGLSRNGKPALRIERLKHIVEWFNQYL